MARFDIGGYTRFNAERAARGRASVRPSTFTALEDVGVYAKDLEGFIAGSEAVYAAKLVMAAEVADYWKSIAPVFDETGRDPKRDEPPYGTSPGTYRDSIKVVRDKGRVAVAATAYDAHWIEYGTSKMEEFGTGAKVLAHFGGSAEESAKVSDKLYVG